MATQPAISEQRAHTLEVQPLGTYPGLRALAWDGDLLYASRGYTLLKTRPRTGTVGWTRVADAEADWWRKLTCKANLSARLVRDGFHALAIHRDGNLVAALPGSIATLTKGDDRFRLSHAIVR